MNNEKIITDNAQRRALLHEKYYPISGRGKHYENRVPVHWSDAPIPQQCVPATMRRVGWAKCAIACKSLHEFCLQILNTKGSDQEIDEIWHKWVELRIKHDFEFWAAMFVMIKDKMSDRDIAFVLNAPQRKLLYIMEDMRRKGAPIRIILLKARQWGGSTLVQIYMAWIQLVHKKNWNSVICAHLKDGASTIKGMYSKLLENYPPYLLESEQEIKFRPFERSSNCSYIQETGCKVTIGSAESPLSIRGADAAMAHLSEVAFWGNTTQRTPEGLVRSVCGSIALLPYSLIVMESTANGTGNYFHRECMRAKGGESDKQFVFVPWYEIEIYTLPINDYNAFVISMNDYEKWLWQKGATLEAIYWYRTKKKEYNNHADMMAEYPSDDVEAFSHSGERVFDLRQVQRLRTQCSAPEVIGEVYGTKISGRGALDGIRFSIEANGSMQLWAYPDNNCHIAKRYVVVVDIGGRSVKADYSVIAVFDRYWMCHGGVPEIVAQWRGHTDHDLLAWKAAQIATYYNNALLVIESNTLETEEREGEHATYVLDILGNHYSNLYARAITNQIAATRPTRWGFHTNRSTKTMVINHLINMLRENGYVERDTEACNEMDVYEKKQNGAFGAIDGHHDDILMTRCIGTYICYNESLPHLINLKEKKQNHQISNKLLSEASI